jgi:hypothetical protein
MKNSFLYFLLIMGISWLQTAQAKDSLANYRGRFYAELYRIQKEKCDVCGCGVGNYYFGIMPQFHRSFAGIRYRNKSFDSHLNISQSGNNQLFATQEKYQTLELWARMYAGSKIQLLAFIPYQFNQQTGNNFTKNLRGLGDMALIANYNLLNQTTDTVPRLFRHSVWLGGGVKLPTGQANFTEDNTQVANANFQLGTGSLDFMLNLIYTLRYDQWGLNTDFTYKINTANQNQYHFGNRGNGTISLFYIQKLGSLALMPNVGSYLEFSARDKDKADWLAQTGGYVWFSSLGLEAYYKNFSVGFNWQNPINQQLAYGHIKAHQRTMLHFTVLF